MERCTIVRWGIVFCFLSCCGCSMTRGMNSAAWWRGKDSGDKKSEAKEQVASSNPFKRKSSKKEDADAKKIADADKKNDKKTDKVADAAKQPDAAAKQADAKPKSETPAAKIASHDTETLKLIEEELKDATPQDRERLYAEWKPLDSALVKEIIRIRRMVRQMHPPESNQQLAQGSQPGAPDPMNAGPRIEPRTAQTVGAGHSAGQLPSTTGRTPTSPLGISPWGQPGEPNANSRYGALDTRPNGPNPYGSFDRAGSPGSSPQDARVGLASGAQYSSDGLGFRQDSTQQAAYGSYPTATPVGVTSADGTFNGGAGGASPGGLNFSPGGIGPSGTTLGNSPQFSGAVSSNGGPQIIAGATPGGLSPYSPPNSALPSNQAAPRGTPGNIIPVAAQTSERPQGFPGGQTAQSAMQAQNATQPQPSGLGALGVGRFFNGTANNAAVPSAAGHMSPVSARWGEELQRLIANAAADVAQTGPGSSDLERRSYVEKHVYLRMLFLMGGQQVRAMEPIPGIEPAEQEFWQQIFWGVSSYFDAEAIPESQDRATQTALQLSGALQRLQEKARLELRNVNFCHKISSFGNYERFQRDEFSAGQPVLIYAEVSNFKSEQATDGQFRTIIKSTIEIFNSRGELIQSMPFPPTEDLCRNQRRDYFHSYEFTVPQRIAIGPHVMKLTVEDQISQKLATYTLNFTVK